MNRASAQRLADIDAAIGRIREYVGDLAQADISSPLVADAVVHNLLVIGEAVKGLDESTRLAAPDVPWADIAGMRDILVHHYFRVDPAIVERTVRKELLPLEEAVRGLLGVAGDPPAPG